MDFGASMFFTDYSMTSVELAQALEARGFESVWAPEHSHIPTSRRTPFPGGGDLPKQYYDAMDPFVTLTAAAMATKKLKVGTGVLPGEPARSDPDRQAGGLDRPGLGRPLPVRHRRRLERRGDGRPRHGVPHAREAGARARRGDEGDLDQIEGRIPRRVRQLPGDDGVAEMRAEAARAGDRRRRVPAGGASRGALWRRLDSAGRPRRHHGRRWQNSARC